MNGNYVQVEKPISVAYADDLKKEIFYISAEIEDFELIIANDKICGIKIKALADTDMDKLARKVNQIINQISKQKLVSAKLIWQSQKSLGDLTEYAFEDMVKQDMAFVAGEGQVCFGEPVLTLMDALDEMFRDIALVHLGGKEYRYPTLIATKTLEDCGYFNSFPHMLMFVTRLHNDIDIYKSFQNEYQAQKHFKSYALRYAQNVDYCLPPTMCYHTYHHLRDQELGDGCNRVITAKGKSFRFESKYHKTVERLWDFTIREIVFLGTKNFVLDSRQEFMKETFALINRLGLTGHCEVASDPFFCSPDSAAKILNQKMQELKYELRLPVSKNQTIAVASFNFHDQFFGERFNICQEQGEYTRTGCVGFGIERFAYAFLCQHGLDPQKWPVFHKKIEKLVAGK